MSGKDEVPGEKRGAEAMTSSEKDMNKRQVNALALLPAAAQQQDGSSEAQGDGEDENIFQQFVLQQHLQKEFKCAAHSESFDTEGQTVAIADGSDDDLGTDKSKARYLRPVLKAASSRVGAEYQAEIPTLESGLDTRT